MTAVSAARYGVRFYSAFRPTFFPYRGKASEPGCLGVLAVKDSVVWRLNTMRRHGPFGRCRCWLFPTWAKLGGVCARRKG